jgi:hypothetical protein
MRGSRNLQNLRQFCHKPVCRFIASPRRRVIPNAGVRYDLVSAQCDFMPHGARMPAGLCQRFGIISDTARKWAMRKRPSFFTRAEHGQLL